MKLWDLDDFLSFFLIAMWDCDFSTVKCGLAVVYSGFVTFS